MCLVKLAALGVNKMVNYYVNEILVLLTLIGLSHTLNTLLVPEQLTSALSIFYSRIPPIRKGIDSRIGMGFRIGPNVDYQILFEVGPQENTLPLGPSSSTNNKRQTKGRLLKEQPWRRIWFQPGGNDVEDVNGNSIRVIDKNIISHLRKLYKQPVVSNDASNLTINAVEKQP